MHLEKFPRLGAHAKQIMTLLGNIYVCKQSFFAMKIIKSDHRSRFNMRANCCAVYIYKYRAIIHGKEAMPNFSLNNLFPHIFIFRRFFNSIPINGVFYFCNFFYFVNKEIILFHHSVFVLS